MSIKLKKVALIFFVLFILSDVFLYFHYKSMGVINNLTGFLLIVALGIILVSLSFQRWNDFLNPVSLYFVFIFGFGYSLLDLSSLIKPFSHTTLLVIVLSIISYVIGAFINLRFKSPFQSLQFTKRSNLLMYYSLLIFCASCFIYEIVLIGYLPIVNIFSFDVYNDSNTKLVSFIHYFVLLFALFPAWTYILYKSDIVKKRLFISVLVFSCFVIINYLSRQIILLFLLSTFISYAFYNKTNVKKILIYGFGLIALFFIIGQVRMAQMETLRKNEKYTIVKFLRNAAGIKYETNLIESTYVLYSSMRYNTLNEFIKKADNEGYYGFGKFVFRPFVSLTFLDRIGIIKYEKEYSINSSVSTYAIDAFLDFRFFGVVFWGLFYGLVSTHFYKNFKSGNKKYIISWSLIVFCLIMSPFMNFFSSFFVFLVWSVNKLII